MRIKLFIVAVVLILPLTVFAQSATPSTLPTPGILPDSPWYFLDQVSEYFQELFTFQPAAKARLELKFAGERLAEIKVLMDEKGAQAKGIEVSGGFILGLDGDGPEVFDAQVAFIQEAGIPRAMVGLLTAMRGTDLYARLEAEGRLLGEASGNNVEIALNFRPQLEPRVLIEGYRRVLATLYEPGLASYFARCWTLVSNLGRGVTGRRRRFETAKLLALLRSLRRQTFSRQAPAYLGFLLRTLLLRPRQVPLAIRLAASSGSMLRQNPS